MTALPGIDVEERFAKELYEDAGRVPRAAVPWKEFSCAEQEVWRAQVQEGRKPTVPTWVSLVDWG